MRKFILFITFLAITVSSFAQKKDIDRDWAQFGRYAEDNAKMLTGITEGYSVSIKRQTADAWYINCKKLKTNKEKDDPKTMELVVAKDTYRPISLSATLSLVTVTIRNLNFGVTESQVTFDPSQYPGARIIDKRQ